MLFYIRFLNGVLRRRIFICLLDRARYWAFIKKGKVVPIEVKSGKDYHRHNALSNVMKNPDYQIEKAYVLYNGNLKVENLEDKILSDDSKVKKSKRIVYLPIYMTMFLDKTQLGTDLIYKVDIDSLNKYVGA